MLKQALVKLKIYCQRREIFQVLTTNSTALQPQLYHWFFRQKASSWHHSMYMHRSLQNLGAVPSSGCSVLLTSFVRKCCEML